VQITNDIASWEKAKLRLLNGAHSAMAYVGSLAGIATVDRFIAEDWGRALVNQLLDEVEPTLGSSPEIDVAAYRERLLARFRNAALGHRLQQIAMDGSQKLPQRLLGPALDLIGSGRSPSTIALVIAAWMRFQSGRGDAGERIEVDDPLASTTARLVSNANSSEEQVKSLLELEAIFPPPLAADPGFVMLVAKHLDEMRRHGARATAESFVEVCT
jgi:fructuronate reductase